MTNFRTYLLTVLAAVAVASGASQSPAQINPDAIRNAPVAGPMRISAEGLVLAASAPVQAVDLIDVHPNAAFVIEGPIRMAIEGLVYVSVNCTVYAGDRPIATFQRAAPVLDGPFEGKFRFGLLRSADGAPTAYACWANAYGTRGGVNWHAYETPAAQVPGGYAQWVTMADGSLWTGAPFTEQVALHVSGALSGAGAPMGPSPAGLRQGLRVPDGSNVQWRPPIIPPLYSGQTVSIQDHGWRSLPIYMRDQPGLPDPSAIARPQ